MTLKRMLHIAQMYNVHCTKVSVQLNGVAMISSWLQPHFVSLGHTYITGVLESSDIRRLGV